MTMWNIRRIALLALSGGVIAAAAWIGQAPSATLTADPTTTSPTPPPTLTPISAPSAPPAPPLP